MDLSDVPLNIYHMATRVLVALLVFLVGCISSKNNSTSPRWALLPLMLSHHRSTISTNLFQTRLKRYLCVEEEEEEEERRE